MGRTPRDYDDLLRGGPQPVSALFHEHSKLTERRMLEFKEAIEAFGDPRAETKAYPTRPAIELPRHRRSLFAARLDVTLKGRRSERGHFRDAPIPAKALGSLLELSLGPTGEGVRSWPSAGARYPLEAYVVALACEEVPSGLYHYDPFRHSLGHLGECPPKEVLSRLVFAGGPGGDRWERAAAALVFTAVFERTQAKYGERGYRFVLLEAGHAAQNVLLVACALGLGAVSLGGFCEDGLGDVLGLDRSVESPVYVILLGPKAPP